MAFQMRPMSSRTRTPFSGVVLAAMFLAPWAAEAADPAAPAPARAALTVNVVQARVDELPLRVAANGNIAAWQEAVIGTESNGLRLADVNVNVGSVVKRGQVLASFAAETVQAALAESRANVAEAQARHAEAVANVERNRDLLAKGFISPQKLNEYVTAENTAAARLDAQKALLKANQLRLDQTRVLSPDDGVISARNATVGAVLPAGQELFRLIRGGRLEWRAEVAAADLARLRAGMAATVTPAGGEPVSGKVRVLAPTVDPKTRNGIVYVDLPQPGNARAGMFAQGVFEIGSSKALTLPQSAVVLRDGFSYAMRVSQEGRVSVVKVVVGRRVADRVEIVSGLDADARVVASGGAFLADGDTVRVVDAAVSKP